MPDDRRKAQAQCKQHSKVPRSPRISPSECWPLAVLCWGRFFCFAAVRQARLGWGSSILACVRQIEAMMMMERLRTFSVPVAGVARIETSHGLWHWRRFRREALRCVLCATVLLAACKPTATPMLCTSKPSSPQSFANERISWFLAWRRRWWW